MELKAESKLSKKCLDTFFSDLSTNQVLNKNVKNINLFFELFEKVKQHRTLEKICQVYTVQERELVFQHYCELIDKLEEHMETFEQFSMKANAKRNKIIVEKEKYIFDEWKQAIEYVSYEGEKLTETIESKLKLIIKAFGLESRVPSLNWKRWREVCTEGILVKKGYCGCFQ